mmetsp:Transcript_29159/g.74399  ORF Transcript_29159/g.74399 Transcript_29159/m.74399 type:complete len:233 (-) Transcript_29159:390-1088(-)
MAVAAQPEVIKGYLILTVEEASGKTSRDQFTWDTNVGSTFEAFVKVELRGGSRNIKAQTRKAQLVGETVTWREELRMEVLEGSNELRLMLCREKFQGTKRGTSVIAACGIFVSDILEAVPIDKYFELFKPNAGGEGGFIRICMNYVKDLSELTAKPAASEGASVATSTAATGTTSRALPDAPQGKAAAPAGDAKAQKGGKKKKGKVAAILVPLVLVASAAGAVTGILLHKRK